MPGRENEFYDRLMAMFGEASSSEDDINRMPRRGPEGDLPIPMAMPRGEEDMPPSPEVEPRGMETSMVPPSITYETSSVLSPFRGDRRRALSPSAGDFDDKTLEAYLKAKKLEPGLEPWEFLVEALPGGSPRSREMALGPGRDVEAGQKRVSRRRIDLSRD